jgi:hypothetical protein
MAYFGKYIRQILSKQEPVIFPGFGSLIIKEGKGVKSEAGKIDPPGAIILFDSTHPRDDSKLASEYASGENIDVEEAGQQLLELVDAIKFKLDKGEAYDLTLVGKFTRDDDNRIHFQKDQNWVIDPELFGLGSLDLLELDAEDAPISDIPTEKLTSERKQVQSEKGKAKTELHETKKPLAKSNRKPVHKWKIIWIVIASLIAVLVLILLIPAGDEGSAIEFGKDGIVIRNTDTEKIPTRTEEQQDTKTQAEEGVVDDKKTEKVPVPVDVPVSENKFFVIAGSFQNLQNATELLDQLKTNGYPAEIIYTENRMYRVSVKSFPTKESAVNSLPSIKASQGLDKVWVWQK